jgi:hypothetical protein
MRRNRMFRALMFAPLAIVAVAVFGFVVMSLWNWLMPMLFNLHTITYWQAFGVLILSRILFGGLGGRPGHRVRQRVWERMSPEQREKFREGMRQRCGEFPEKGEG